ncbi:hypothetical protein V6N12_058838 [Hibiscus sabdariffa]|uniref:Uncharacterized protein n=1 Tax=Hibiscus sabdariffa TaxID=183260 RepID=A0ABR2ETB4_9ROSI
MDIQQIEPNVQINSIKPLKGGKHRQARDGFRHKRLEKLPHSWFELKPLKVNIFGAARPVPIFQELEPYSHIGATVVGATVADATVVEATIAGATVAGEDERR